MEIPKHEYSPDLFKSPRDNALYLTVQLYAGKRMYFRSYLYFKRLMKRWLVYHKVGYGEFREKMIGFEENPQKVKELLKSQLEIQL